MRKILLVLLVALSLSAGLNCEAAKKVEAKTVDATVTVPTGWTTQLGTPPSHKTISKDPFTGAVSIASLTGTITLQYQDGTSINIEAGTGVVVSSSGSLEKDASGNAVRSLSDMLKADTSGSLRASITSAITSIAEEISAGGLDTKGATTKLAAIMKTMSQADPTGTPDLVQAAVSALTAGGGTPSKTVTNAVAAVVAGATSNPAVSSTDVTNAANKGASDNKVTLPDNVVSSSGANNVLNNGSVINGRAITQIDVTATSPAQ
jgi:hypothetical protein